MSIRKAATWAMSSQYYGFILQFVASILLARYFISPRQLGLFSISFAAISLIAFLQDFGVARYISGEKDLTEEKRRTAYTVSMAISWLIAAFCVGLAWPMAAYYGNPGLVEISLVIACSYFLVPFAIVPQALRQREMDFKSSALIDMGAASANAAVALYLGWQGHGAMALAWGAFAQQAGRAIVAQWRVGGMAPWPLRFREPGRIFSFGGTNTVLVLSHLIAERAPELFIGRLFGAAPVGLYARGIGLAQQLRLLLVGAVSGVFYPAFRKMRDDGEPLGKPYILVAGAFTAIMWPALAGLAVLAEPTVHFLYGEKWLAAAPILFWLAMAQMAFVAAPISSDLAILLDRKGEVVVRNLLDLLVALALLFAAIPYGLEGVAASRVVHGLLFLVNFTQFSNRLVGFSWYEWLGIQLRSAVVTLFAITPALVFYRIWDTPQDAGFIQIFVSALCGIVLWLFGLWLVRHPIFAEGVTALAPLRERLTRPTASPGPIR